MGSGRSREVPMGTRGLSRRELLRAGAITGAAVAVCPDPSGSVFQATKK